MKKMSLSKRALSVVLSVTLAATLCPATALADEVAAQADEPAGTTPPAAEQPTTPPADNPPAETVKPVEKPKPVVDYRTMGKISGVKAKYEKKGAVTGKTVSTKPITYIKIKNDSKNIKGNITYKVRMADKGWTGWKKNGAKAGTNDKSKAMTAYQVKLVAKKGGKAPNMDRKAYSSKSGFINKITGVAKVDDNIKKFCQKNGMDLKKCFAALDKKYQYANTGYSAIKGAFKSDRFKKEAQLFFKNFKNGVKKSGTQGDCYSAAAGLAAVAQHLGYNATAVTGKAELKNKNTGELTILNTAWTEIKVNGKKTVSTLLYHVYADPYDGEQGAKFKKN